MKYELRKGDMVKRTKSAALVALLERNGWERIGSDAPVIKPPKPIKKGA